MRSFPDVNKERWQVSSNRGGSPLWSPDGRELFYRSGDATMAVEIETEPTFKRGNPKVLFKGKYSSSTYSNVTITPPDISPDGKRFLMIKPSGVPAGGSTAEKPATAPQWRKINIVLNWFEEPKQRVPVK